MFAVSVSLECTQVNLYAGEDEFAALVITGLEYFLHHVVPKGIFHHSLQLACSEQIRAQKNLTTKNLKLDVKILRSLS